MIDHDIRPVASVPLARPAAVEKGDYLAPQDWPDLRENDVLKGLAWKYNKTEC